MPRANTVQLPHGTETAIRPTVSAALTVAGFIGLAAATAFLLGPGSSSEPAQPWPTVVGIAGGVSALAGLCLARWGVKR